MQKRRLLVAHSGSSVFLKSAVYLRENGYDVLEADSNQMCSELIARENPPLVLCNLMPSQTGACRCYKQLNDGSANGRPWVIHFSDTPTGAEDDLDGSTQREVLPCPKHSAELLPWIKMLFRCRDTRGEGQFKAVFDNAPMGILLFGADGQVSDANSAMCEMAGLSRQQMLSRGIDTFLDPEAKKSVQNFRSDLAAGKSTHTRYRSGHQRVSDRTYRNTMVYCAAYEMQDKHHCMAFVDDMTEQRQVEKRLYQSQKMEAIGALAGGIAHEFNNILGIIVGNTELAADEISSANLAQEFLTEIRAASRRAKDVVRKILSFARKTAFDPQPLRIGSLIEEAARFLRPTIPATIEIRTHIQCYDETIFADATEMNQVLMNLISNAVHAIPDQQGVIEVNLDSLPLDEAGASGYDDLKPGVYVRLTVRDSGIGISSDDLTHIFVPYFTNKEINQGAGMGLAIVYGIIKKHSGDITVRSKLGEGTVLTVLLPVVAATVEMQENMPDVLPTGSESILVVDDELSFVKLVDATLRQLGYDIRTTTSSTAALEMVAESPDYFDLMIIGMAMPKMSGDELARRIMEIRGKMPIILCTGHSDSIDAAGAKAMGISAFVLKPIEKQAIAATVRRLLDQR